MFSLAGLDERAGEAETWCIMAGVKRLSDLKGETEGKEKETSIFIHPNSQSPAPAARMLMIMGGGALPPPAPPPTGRPLAGGKFSSASPFGRLKSMIIIITINDNKSGGAPALYTQIRIPQR